MNSKKFVIASRGSDLALKQSNMVKAALENAFPHLKNNVEIQKIVTSGDKITDRPLYEVGGKGLFVKEIDEQLIAGKADIAVHSLKDVPGLIPDELMIAAVLEREDPRDALLSKKHESFSKLPEFCRFGTSSIRRKAQILSKRPDINVVAYRGNLPTRISKLEAGEVDATILAVAGLKRLGLESNITEIFENDFMLPAIGQGAIAISTRKDNLEALEMLKAINSEKDFTAIIAERAIMIPLNANCTTPLAAFAKVDGNNLHIRAMLFSPEGIKTISAERFGFVEEAYDLGYEIGDELLGNGKDLI